MGLLKCKSLDPKNFKKICRICLEEKPNLFYFTTEITFLDENVESLSILNVLEVLTSESVLLNNNLPSQLCTDCLNLLKSAYIFKEKHKESNDILKTLFSKVIKTETDSNSDFIECEFDHSYSISQTQNDAKEEFYMVSNKDVENKEAFKTNEECKGKLHPCPICTMELPAIKLREHAFSHKALKNYLDIPKVNKNARFYATPRETTSIFAQKEIRHICPYCKLELATTNYRLHVQNHRMRDEFKCDQCPRIFRKENHLKMHRIKHLKECPYECDQCGKGFVIKRNYECHKLTHTNDTMPYECSQCLRRFSNPEHLNRHRIIHTENVSYHVKYKFRKCNKCLRTFKDKEFTKDHQCVRIKFQRKQVKCQRKQINYLRKQNYSCKKCEKTFDRSSSLYNHMRLVHNAQSRKALCYVCGLYVSNIYNHMRSHTLTKQYKCNQCPKSFLYSRQLKQHLLVHSGLKPFVCCSCGKAFNNLYNLQVHERIHKGIRCHVCPVCDKKFLEKSYLNKHMNVHKKIKS